MNSDHKELLKHSSNYLLAVIANKALSFISIPVMTYLLSVEDYGVVNVFSSTAAIFAVLLTLNTEVAISRYFYDAKDEEDFKRFVGTSIRFSFAIFVLLSVLLVLFSEPLSEYLGFERLLTICLIPYALYTIVNGVFQQIYQPMLKSKKIATVSSLTVYFGFAMSVVCILLLSEKKYYGMVFGAIIIYIVASIYLITQILKYSSNCFDTKFLKYILSFTLPYLPYSLSSIIVAQFGKMILGQQESFNSAGLYSFAQNLSGLMLIVIVVTHSAWNHYHMRYMNEKNYKKLNCDYDIIWRATLICGAFLSLFCYEIGIVIARPQYLSALFLIPIIVLGYLFYQWSYVYLRNTAYVKKTIWNAVVVVASGVLNVALNSLLIKDLKILGIAISFAISYGFMLLFSCLINKYILKAYVPPFMMFAKPLLLFVPLFFLS